MSNHTSSEIFYMYGSYENGISIFGGNISVMIYFEMNNSYIKYKQWYKCSNINVVNVITL